MKPQYLAVLAMAVAAAAGLAQAEESTRVYRQGSSTATITQSGGGSSTMVRRTVRGPDSQTIIQRQGGNSVTVRQSVEEDGAAEPEGDALSAPEDDADGVQIVVSMSPEAQRELRDLALDEDTTVEALVEEAIQDFLDGYR